MSDLAIIVLARALHIGAGVVWAGSTFVMSAVILPLMIRHGADGFARWSAPIARRVGPISGIAALLTVLSGIYLFAVLHAQDASRGALLLKIGAASAVLSLLTGFLVSRPTGLKLAALSEDAAAAQPEVRERIAALRRRAAISARFAAVLLGVSVLSMAMFRYVGTL